MAVEVIRTSQGLEDAFRRLAREIFNLSKSPLAQGDVVVGLCGGRSVVGLLGALEQEATLQSQENLRRLQFYMVDERLVPLEDSQSNFGGLKRQLFSSLIERECIREEQLHPFVPDRSLADWGCSRYADNLKERGGRFSVVVLGVGEDGHIAGLFPGHRALKEATASFTHFDDSPKSPSGRMTATPTLITAADLCILLVLGEAKQEAWRLFNDPHTSVETCPAKLATLAKRCLVVTDLP